MFLVYYPRQLLSGASYSLTVAPILWGIRVCSVWSFLSLIYVFGLDFFIVWVFWSLDWLTVTFVLWLFAHFHRFCILALGHLGAFVFRAFLGSFRFLLVQSTLWSLLYIRLVFFYCLIALFEWSFSFPFKFRLVSFGPRLHGSFGVFEILFVLRDFWSIWGLIMLAIEWNLHVLLYYHHL